MNTITDKPGVTRILLADDHAIVREGLRALLEREADISVVAESSDGRSTVATAKKFLPDIVLMDINMPDLNGIEATHQLKNELPEIRVIVLSMHVDKYMVGLALQAGARGFLPKDCASEELAVALRTVAGHKIYISPNLGFPVYKSVLHETELQQFVIHSLLTQKEREVLQLIAEGHPSKEIASRLRSSIRTIEHHRQHIMSKLNLHSIADLTKFAIREGMTSLEIRG